MLRTVKVESDTYNKTLEVESADLNALLQILDLAHCHIYMESKVKALEDALKTQTEEKSALLYYQDLADSRSIELDKLEKVVNQKQATINDITQRMNDTCHNAEHFAKLAQERFEENVKLRRELEELKEYSERIIAHQKSYIETLKEDLDTARKQYYNYSSTENAKIAETLRNVPRSTELFYNGDYWFYSVKEPGYSWVSAPTLNELVDKINVVLKSSAEPPTT